MAFKKVRNPKQEPKKRNKIQALFWMDPSMATMLKKTAKRLKVSQSELARAAFTHIDEHKLWESLAARVNTAAAAASEAA